MRTSRLLAAGLLLTLAACGGGSSSPTGPSTTAPVGPSQAQITVTCAAPELYLSSRPGFQYAAIFTCNATESAGVGANANYVRAQFTNAGGVEIERQEISSADLLLQLGSNRLNARSTFTGQFRFDFNAGNSTGGLLSFNFTDDRGNVLTAPFTFSWS